MGNRNFRLEARHVSEAVSSREDTSEGFHLMDLGVWGKFRVWGLEFTWIWGFRVSVCACSAKCNQPPVKQFCT